MDKHFSIKRWHPYLGEWVILAPVTDRRPWSGALVKKTLERGPGFDPGCYLCPGVQRSTGKANPAYPDVFVFDNDFASLTFERPGRDVIDGMGGGELAQGVCRVVCFSPEHNVTLAEMDAGEIEKVLHAWRAQFEDLSAKPGIEYVMQFENKGKEIGVSNPHPHGQIYSTDFIPRLPAAMYDNASKFSASHGGACVFCAELEKELADGSGVVCRNEHFAALVPSFARFKYEVHILPLRHVPYITSLNATEITALARIYRQVLVKYDNLFGMIIPNITIFYNAPVKPGLDVKPWHFHIQFAPPLRSADKLKYLAGFETGGGNIINPSLPKDSAEELRRAPETHFSKAQP